MSRFIFYSGLAHCLAFVSVVTYMSTRPKESLPEFLQSKSTPHVEVTSSRELVEMGVASGSTARANSEEIDSNREMRERKVRANLPTPPETPRVVDKVNAAKKVPTQLPMKKGVSKTQNIEEASSPEIGSDISPIGDLPVAAETEADPTTSTTTSNEQDSTVEDQALTEETESSATDTETVAQSEEETENLQIAAFDVDELAESHLEKMKEKEELEHAAQMEKLAAEKVAALAALRREQSAEVESSAGTGDEGSEAKSSSGSSEGAAVMGEPSSDNVRTLSELRQSPGNKKPQYDVEDRRQGRQGLVVFLAYIQADGRPKEFQMAASSGHRSLDAKTLKTLKGWKFQPGQEGWVEIPFQWDLKGGAQEAPSNLRRQVSRQ